MEILKNIEKTKSVVGHYMIFSYHYQLVLFAQFETKLNVSAISKEHSSFCQLIFFVCTFCHSRQARLSLEQAQESKRERRTRHGEGPTSTRRSTENKEKEVEPGEAEEQKL